MLKNYRLGKKGPEVGCLGYGAMVLEGYYGHSDDDQAVETIRHAVDAGMMIDSADAYGAGHNERLGRMGAWQCAVAWRRDHWLNLWRIGIRTQAWAIRWRSSGVAMA